MRRIAKWALPVFAPLMALYPAWGATPTITISTTPASPISFGQAFALTATFSGSPTATGQIQFIDGSAGNSPIGGVINLSGGVGTFNAPSNSGLAVGTHYISVIYSGDGNYSPVFSTFPSPPSCGGVTPCYALVINQGLQTTTTTICASVASAACSTTPASFPPDVNTTIITATVTPANPGTVAGGTVTFLFDGSPISGSSNHGQTSTCFPCLWSFAVPSNSLSLGNHTVTAQYNGDVDNLPSTSNSITLSLVKSATTTTVSPNPASIAPNQTTTITATVTPTTANPLTGTVTLLLNGSPVTGSSNLNVTCTTVCTATFTVPANTLAVGNYAVVAQYGGDGSNSPSNSLAANLLVAYPPSIPDLSTWGIVLTALLLLSAGLVMARRAFNA